jgi:hypothetical protein
MASYSSKKNLLQSRDTYSRYYGDFRGVDFSNDHTQVIDQRLAYSVNMFKDYQSAQGKALETVAGFRRRFEAGTRVEIYGIHQFEIKKDDGKQQKILVHAGNNLYFWHNYPLSVGVTLKDELKIEDNGTKNDDGTTSFVLKLNGNVFEIESCRSLSGEPIAVQDFSPETQKITIVSHIVKKGDYIIYEYLEGKVESPIFTAMNPSKSKSFIFNNLLYIIDGKNYLVYDGQTVKSVLENAYIPTTYINTIPAGENANVGVAYEPINALQPKFKQTFIPDGLTYVYYLNAKELDEDSKVEIFVYGVKKEQNADFDVDYNQGKITFKNACIPPVHPDIAEELNAELSDKAEAGENVTLVNSGSDDEDITNAAKFPKYYAGVEIIAQKTYDSSKMTGCTLFSIFDERVFLSGNSEHHNDIYFSSLNNPSYFPLESYMSDGTGSAAITGMLVVADTLMVLKENTQQDGSIYFHTPKETNDNLYPKIYPSTRGLAGTGCLGASINFLDDPVFLSKLGVEGVGQLSVRYERAIEHRSSLIDAKLVNLGLDALKRASFEEWNGYLILLVDGKIFMADSRQRYTDESGYMQYEWYYLEDIGIYDNQYLEYRYAKQLYSELKDVKVTYHYCKSCGNRTSECTCERPSDHTSIDLPLLIANAVLYADTGEIKDLTGTVANAPNVAGTPSVDIIEDSILLNDGIEVEVCYALHKIYDEITNEFKGYEAYLCESRGNYTGGIYRKGCVAKNIDDNLFFGTENGIICSFNFDKRDEFGEIPNKYYSFDNRTIKCGCATKMDACGIPHLTKNTVKKSTVIKTKSFQTSAAKIKVRTNKKPYSQIARIGSSLFSFDDMDFSDFSFVTTEQTLFSIREKEKQWVEKQYYIYSDEYLKPFALFYISYRYNIAGRYKG